MTCQAEWIELIRSLANGAGGLIAFGLFIWFFRTMIGR